MYTLLNNSLPLADVFLQFQKPHVAITKTFTCSNLLYPIFAFRSFFFAQTRAAPNGMLYI